MVMLNIWEKDNADSYIVFPLAGELNPDKTSNCKKKYCLFRSETLRMEIHVGFDTILLYKNPSCFWLPKELLLSVSTISGTIIAN